MGHAWQPGRTRRRTPIGHGAKQSSHARAAEARAGTLSLPHRLEVLCRLPRIQVNLPGQKNRSQSVRRRRSSQLAAPCRRRSSGERTLQIDSSRRARHPGIFPWPRRACWMAPAAGTNSCGGRSVGKRKNFCLFIGLTIQQWRTVYIG
jgi:hypothetical protein